MRIVLTETTMSIIESFRHCIEIVYAEQKFRIVRLIFNNRENEKVKFEIRADVLSVVGDNAPREFPLPVEATIDLLRDGVWKMALAVDGKTFNFIHKPYGWWELIS